MIFGAYMAGRLRLGKEKGKSAPAVKVAVVAVALSICVMLCSIAVVGGFRNEIMDRVAGFNSHLTIFNPADDALVYLGPSLRGALDDEEYITGYELELSVPAIAKTDNDFKGLYLRGFDGNEQYHFIARFIDEGTMPDFTRPGSDTLAVISRRQADELNLHAGDRLPFYFINDGLSVRPLKVAGIYDTHFDYYDDLFAFCAPGMLRGVAGVTLGKGTSLRISTTSLMDAPRQAIRLTQRLMTGVAQGELAGNYMVDDITHQGANYYSWLALLDTNVAVILGLMSVVAALTLISALLILVIDKISLIGILRAMGTSGKVIRSIFIFMSLRIALAGMALGNGIALIILLIQKKYHIIPLNAESYYMDYVPVNLDWSWILLLNAAVFILILLLLILPSWSASRLSPVRAMTYH